MPQTSFYTEQELKQLGLKSFGKNVLISRYANIYSANQIEIGDNVRIDDFSILSGRIILGSNIHISAYCALYGSMGITLEDYTGISPRTILFSAMDDFSGNYLIGPVHTKDKTNIKGGEIIMRKFSQLGAGCIVFPNVELKEGAVVGAMSLVNKSLSEFSINIGVPVRFLKKRNRKIVELI